MCKISVIGICGNSIFMNVDHFHEMGETVNANSVYEEIGGKGINQAVACAKMGAEVSFLGAIGDDADAEKCRQVANEYGINGFFAVKKGLKTTFAVILTDKNGEKQTAVFYNIGNIYKSLAAIYESKGNADMAGKYSELYKTWLAANRNEAEDIDAQGFAK